MRDSFSLIIPLLEEVGLLEIVNHVFADYLLLKASSQDEFMQGIVLDRGRLVEKFLRHLWNSSEHNLIRTVSDAVLDVTIYGEHNSRDQGIPFRFGTLRLKYSEK
jgi:hypothetical protein